LALADPEELAHNTASEIYRRECALFASSAPYVVTALVSLISWILSTYHSEVRSAAYLKYEIVNKSDADWETAPRFKFTNISPSVLIEGLTVALVCPNSTPCFGKTENGSVAFGETRNVEPWSMAIGMEPSATLLTQPIKLPPGMAFEMVGYVKTRGVVPKILISADASSSTNVKILPKENFEVWFATHYLQSLFAFWLLSAIIILVALLNRSKPQKSEPVPVLLHVKLLKREV
jgi:hypothetical protein